MVEGLEFGERLRPSCEAGHYPIGDQCELDLAPCGNPKNRQRLRPPCSTRQSLDNLLTVWGSGGKGGVRDSMDGKAFLVEGGAQGNSTLAERAGGPAET